MDDDRVVRSPVLLTPEMRRLGFDVMLCGDEAWLLPRIPVSDADLALLEALLGTAAESWVSKASIFPGHLMAKEIVIVKAW